MCMCVGWMGEKLVQAVEGGGGGGGGGRGERRESLPSRAFNVSPSTSPTHVHVYEWRNCLVWAPPAPPLVAKGTEGRRDCVTPHSR